MNMANVVQASDDEFRDLMATPTRISLNEEESAMQGEHFSDDINDQQNYCHEEHLNEILKDENDQNICDGELKEIEVVTPELGLMFEKYEEMFEMFRKYGCHKGFSVRKRNSRKGDDGELRWVTLECSRGKKLKISNGLNVLRRRLQYGTGCKVKLSARCHMDGKWEITQLDLEHNHELSPHKICFARCNQKLTPSMKRQLILHDIAGVRPNKSINTLVVGKGEYENMGCVDKNCKNFIEKERRLRLGEADAQTILKYFVKMQASNTGFVFCMDLDEGDRLRNVFWADGRCREAYKEFGDVVTFDSTYLTNKYDMPFSPFVGVNHHGQSILLGCALLTKEDTETFVWLFTTWLQCMGGGAPKGIITHQDRAMQKAIEFVFPNSRHRWCLWHIMKKLNEKIKGYNENESICATFKNVVYETQTTTEFEKLWGEMIDKYKLQKNTWLLELYEERRRWVPCFVKTMFCACMSTTQSSESIDSFFDGYVNSKTTLKQFVEQYENALRNKVEKELYADYQSFTMTIPCLTIFGMEQQVQEMYTIKKFREFVEELTGKMYCKVIDTREGVEVTEFDVQARTQVGDFRKTQIFTVSFHSTSQDVLCSCHMFEFKGILCRHALHVLIEEYDVDLLPEKYILRRWRKDVKRGYSRCKITYNGWVTTVEQKKYDELVNLFSKLADLGATDNGRYKRYKEFVEIELKEQNKTKSSCGSGSKTTDKSSQQSTIRCTIDSAENAIESIGDPLHNTPKGRHRSVRLDKTYGHGKQAQQLTQKNQENNIGDSSLSQPKRKRRTKQQKTTNEQVPQISHHNSQPEILNYNPYIWPGQLSVHPSWGGYLHTPFTPPPPFMNGPWGTTMYGPPRPPTQHAFFSQPHTQ